VKPVRASSPAGAETVRAYLELANAMGRTFTLPVSGARWVLVVLPIREEEPPRTPNSSSPLDLPSWAKPGGKRFDPQVLALTEAQRAILKEIHTKYGTPWKSPTSFVMPEEDKTFDLKLD
jgi:hypothetical protein